MYKIFSIVLSVLIFTACHDSEYIPDKTGKEILMEYNEVSSKLKSADFTIRYYFDNFTDQRDAYRDTVNIIVQRDDALKSVDFPFNVSIDYMDNIDIIYTDNISYLIDHNQKKMTLGYFDSLEYALNIQGNWIENTITELILPNDLSQLFLNLKDTILVKPVEKINGKECYAIFSESYFAQYNVTMQQHTWIDVETKLPVRIKQKQISENDSSEMITDYFVNEIDFELDGNVLDIEQYTDYDKEIYKPKERKELLSVGNEAPDFELINHNGDKVSLKDYRGKVVLIDFWGTWCVWCVKSFPKLEEAYEKLKDKNVEFLGISCQEPADAEPVKFARDKGITYPILLDGDLVSEKYNISGFPTFYIIDQNGQVILAKSGYSEELDDIIINTITPFLN